MRIKIENVVPQGEYSLTYQQIMVKPGLYQPAEPAPDGAYLLVTQFNKYLGKTEVLRVTSGQTIEGGPLGILYPASRWFENIFREVYGTITVECDGTVLTKDMLEEFHKSQGVGALPVGLNPFNAAQEPETVEA